MVSCLYFFRDILYTMLNYYNSLAYNILLYYYALQNYRKLCTFDFFLFNNNEVFSYFVQKS